MAAVRSAGLLLYRRRPGTELEVLVAHMGGPLWERRDAGAWSIPKGEYDDAEEPLDAARREFAEELGQAPPDGDYLPLGEVRQAGGKRVTAWAVEADLDPRTVVSGTFALEWPRGSGVVREYPEVDRVAWLPVPAARERLVRAQTQFLDRLLDAVAGRRPD